MNRLRATTVAHAMIRAVVGPGDTVVDATVGNGHDTAFLADLVGPTGRVIGFDVQAIAVAAVRLRMRHAANVTLIAAGHERLADHVPADVPLVGAMFNLGYLPGSNKHIATAAESTLAALHAVLDRLKVGGRVTLVLYTGHPGGAVEAAAVKAAVADLPPAFESGLWTRPGARSPAPELMVVDRVA